MFWSHVLIWWFWLSKSSKWSINFSFVSLSVYFGQIKSPVIYHHNFLCFKIMHFFTPITIVRSIENIGNRLRTIILLYDIPSKKFNVNKQKKRKNRKTEETQQSDEAVTRSIIYYEKNRIVNMVFENPRRLWYHVTKWDRETQENCRIDYFIHQWIKETTITFIHKMLRSKRK